MRMFELSRITAGCELAFHPQLRCIVEQISVMFSVDFTM